MIYVYKVISPSNKVYIGVTKNFSRRKTCHKTNSKQEKYGKYGTKFKAAIRKYGDKLIWQIIDIAINYDTAFELEKRYILHFDSYNNGYNMTLGGDGITKESKYPKEECLIIASQYMGRNEWRESCGGSYNKAKEYGVEFFKECCKHMIRPESLMKFNKEQLINSALKYNSKSEWNHKEEGYYKAAKKYGNEFFEECCKHMEVLNIKWTEEMIINDLVNYKSYTEWRLANRSSYQPAYGIDRRAGNTRLISRAKVFYSK